MCIISHQKYLLSVKSKQTKYSAITFQVVNIRVPDIVMLYLNIEETNLQFVRISYSGSRSGQLLDMFRVALIRQKVYVTENQAV